MVLLAPSVSAQVRDTRGLTPGTGVISGTILTDNAEGAPVRKARVTCNGDDGSGDTTITDNDGRFVFAGLGAGRYTIAASKPAWVPIAYGAKRPARPGVPIALAAAQRADIVLRMTRGSVITGMVRDVNNQPAAGVSMRAMRDAIVGGTRRLDVAALATTDDRGAYRIYGLAAGDYIVAAGGGRTGLGPNSSAEVRLTSDADVRYAAAQKAGAPATPQRGVELATTYYPGTTAATQAGVVSVGAAEERSGVDLTLQLIPTARIDGTVLLPGSDVPAGAQVNLIASTEAEVQGPPLEGLRTSSVSPDGSFTFAGVSPGRYTLLARAARRSTTPDSAVPLQILWASTQVSLDGEPLTGLSLSLEPGLTISGQVRFEPTTLKPPADLRTIRVSATPVAAGSSVSFAPGAVNTNADGRFTLVGITPGRYRLSASFPNSGKPGGWQLKSIVVAADESAEDGFTVQSDQHVLDAAIVFTDRLAQITGTLPVAAGGHDSDEMVVLFPAKPTRWLPESRRIQAVRPAADGAFAFRNLPADEYLIAVVDDVEPGEWFDAAFLRRIAAGAVKVSVAGAEQVVQNLTRADRR